MGLINDHDAYCVRLSRAGKLDQLATAGFTVFSYEVKDIAMPHSLCTVHHLCEDVLSLHLRTLRLV